MRYVKILIALALLGFVFFGSVPENIDINTIPDEVDEVEELIQVDKPSEEILLQVRPVANLVTETEDRAKLALFNHEFATRITKYNTDVKQVNDLYTKAGAIFFEDKLKGKYENYAQGLKSLVSSVTTDENHVLSNEEKEVLQKVFNGLAWALIER